jgi:hypothetical protein
MKNIIFGIILLCLGQIGAWIQQFAKFKWEWFRDNEWFNIFILSIPLGYFFIKAADLIYGELGSAWSVRMLQFSLGTLLMFLLTMIFLNEGLNLKNGICVGLAFIIILIQAFW